MGKVYNTDLKISGRQQRINGLLHRITLRGVEGILHAQGDVVPSDGEIGWAKGCYYIQTDGGVGQVLYINDGSETSADFNVFTASGSVAYDDINAPDANKTLAFAGFTNLWTSTLNGGTMFTLRNNTADLTSATRLLDLIFVDDGDADGLFLRMLDNTGDVKVTFGVNGNLSTVGTITVGVDDAGADVQLFGATAGAHLLWDESADTLKLVGGAKTDLQGTLTVGVDDTGYDVNFFGATSGQKFFWDESANTAFLTCTVDIDGTVTVGVDDTGYDVKFFGATTAKSWLWDESADKMIVTGASDLLGAVTVGVDDTGHDVTFFGATAGKKFVWDESADEIVMDGNIKVNAGQKIYSSVSNTFYPVLLDQAQQAINANGAITLTQYNTAITSVDTSGQAFTLADGTVIGQVKRIQLIVDGGDATVTFNTSATVVFADVGDVAELIWNGADWLPIALYNIVDGATAPAYTPA